MNDEQFALLVSVDTKVTTLLLHKNDHERRLRNLEKARNWVTGVAATIAAAVSWFFSSSPNS